MSKFIKERDLDSALSTKLNGKLDDGGPATADLDMGTHKLTGVVDPTADQDAATKKWVTDNFGTPPGGGPFALIQPPTAHQLAAGVPLVVVIPDTARWVWFRGSQITAPADGGPSNMILDTATGNIFGVFDNGVGSAIATGVHLPSALSLTVALAGASTTLVTAYTAPVLGVSNGSITLLASALTSAWTFRMMG